jgi:hypothetical protein
MPKNMEYFPSLHNLDINKFFTDKVNTHFKNRDYSLYDNIKKDY